MNGQAFDPDQFHDEFADTLSYGDYQELKFFKLNARAERSRRDKVIEKQLSESLELKLTIQIRNPTSQ